MWKRGIIRCELKVMFRAWSCYVHFLERYLGHRENKRMSFLETLLFFPVIACSLIFQEVICLAETIYADEYQMTGGIRWTIPGGGMVFSI